MWFLAFRLDRDCIWVMNGWNGNVAKTWVSSWSDVILMWYHCNGIFTLVTIDSRFTLCCSAHFWAGIGHFFRYTRQLKNYYICSFLLSNLLKFTEVMEKLQFDYSYKNIPILSERNYKLQLMEIIEIVIKRMRWKEHFYNKKKDFKENETQTIPKSYGLKSWKCAPQVKELIQFERDLLDMIKALKFQKTRSHLQETTQ